MKYSSEITEILELALSGHTGAAASKLSLFISTIEYEGDVKTAKKLRKALAASKGSMIIAKPPKLYLPKHVVDKADMFIKGIKMHSVLTADGITVPTVLCIDGPSGCGKTALVEYIASALSLPIAEGDGDADPTEERLLHIKGNVDLRYWNLSCDIAAEHIIDGCDLRPVRFSRSLLRRETYRKLEQERKVLNAERICRLLSEWKPGEKELAALEKEFYVDDHRFWENQIPGKQPDPELNRRWKDIDEKMETDLETFSKESAEKSGDLLGQLKVENRDRHDYREFLRKFSVLREELKPDPDTFDYGFYSYGLSLYGNMPLIEPQESREVKKIADFVIVIDTSMSVSGEPVKNFLEETYSVLREQDSFFRKVNIHIIQCDEKVHSDVKITDREELDEYMKNLELYGEGGTDFRPAFSYVEELLGKGEFDDLKGLIYFTDGFGIYPDKMPPYKTAFVFLEEDYRDADVPPWAIKLILREEELEKHERA